MRKKASGKSTSNNKLTNKNLNTIKVICCSVLIIILFYYIVKYIAYITVYNNIPTIENFTSYTDEPLLSIFPTKNLIEEDKHIQHLSKEYSIMTISSNAKSDKMYCINTNTNDMFKSLCNIEQTTSNNKNINITCKYADSSIVPNKNNYTLNNPEITQQYTISDNKLPPCTRNNGGHLLANNSSTVFYYNQPINETKKLDCLYYANYNDNVLKCKALPSISIYNNAIANQTNTPMTTNTYLKYDKIKTLCVNDNILLAMGCTNTLYYLKLDNIVDNQWIKCVYPVIANTTINYIGINDKLVFMLIYDYMPTNTNSNTKLIYTMSDSIGSSVDWITWVEQKDTNIQNNPLKETLYKFTLNNNILIAFDNINYILWSCPIILNSSSILDNTLWKKYEYKDVSLFSYSITDISIYLNVLYMFFPNSNVLIIPLNISSGGASSGSSSVTSITSNSGSSSVTSITSNSGSTSITSNSGSSSITSNSGSSGSSSITSNSGSSGSSSVTSITSNSGSTSITSNSGSSSITSNSGSSGSSSITSNSGSSGSSSSNIDSNVDNNVGSNIGSNAGSSSSSNPNYYNTNTNHSHGYNNNHSHNHNHNHNHNIQPNMQPNNPYIHHKITSSFFPLVKIS